MKKRVSCVTALLVSCLFGVAASVSAQTQTESPAPASSQNTQPSDSVESADLAITANVTARELRFEVVPNTNVEFTGSHERKTVWDAERQNLPRPVQPGVTYRDIGIRLKITSVFADIDRIVAEALGEVPVTEDAPQGENTQPANAPPPSPATQQPPGGTPQ